MSRIAYVNGQYSRHAEAAVHIEDRGYQFADGVYEACEVRAGAIIDRGRHLARLARSLAALEIARPMTDAALGLVMAEVIRRNRVINGLIYLQVSRGVARRDHAFPSPAVPPSLVITARPTDPAKNHALAEAGVSVITVPDTRWDRVDIKTTGLLPNVLAKQQAKLAGAREAWFVDADGMVTEGASTNAWIVTADGVLVTRPADHGILAGVTRSVVLDLAARLGLRVELRKFSVAEAQRAREAFLTAATTVVMPVIAIDGVSVGNGHPGSIALHLRRDFHSASEQTNIYQK